MRTAILLATVSVIAIGHVARADPSHVKVAQCSPLIRQELLTIVGHPLVIAFPAGENAWMAPMSGTPDPAGRDPLQSKNIEGVKPDDLAKQPVHNLVTLWPDLPGVTTMTVVAQTSDGTLKTYPFTLTSIPDDSKALENADVTLNLICKNGFVPTPVIASAQGKGTPTSPMAPVVRAVIPRKQVATVAMQAEAEEKLRTDSFNGTGDASCHYHAKGKRPSKVEPLCPMDNGQWTLVRFKGLTHKPAIYVGSCTDGSDEERLPRQHESGDFVVLEEIVPQFCLRLGSNPDDVLQIINDQYDPAGNDPGTGTISPAVRRDVIQAKSR